MICNRCQLFCDEAARQMNAGRAAYPQSPEENIEGTKWTFCRFVVHCSSNELESAAELGCNVCKLISQSLVNNELVRLLDPVFTILELDPSDKGMPVLLAKFEDAAGKPLLPKRTIAIYSGKVSSGMFAYAQC